jgi:hypothetical protein
MNQIDDAHACNVLLTDGAKVTGRKIMRDFVSALEQMIFLGLSGLFTIIALNRGTS